MESTPLLIDATSLQLGQSAAPRTKGLHASTVYNDLYADLEPKRYRHEEGSTPPPLLLEQGMIVETALEDGLKRRLEGERGGEIIQRPGEFTHHYDFEGHQGDMYFTPDLFIYNGVGLRVGEVKSTSMLSTVGDDTIAAAQRGDPDAIESLRLIPLLPKFDKFMHQMQFYCCCLTTPHARLYTFFMRGNNRPPFPQLLAWDLFFTEDELATTYSIHMNHAAYRRML